MRFSWGARKPSLDLLPMICGTHHRLREAVFNHFLLSFELKISFLNTFSMRKV